SGSRLWGTYYGGSENEGLFSSCTVSNTGFVYLAGQTNSTSDIASYGAYQTIYGGNTDAFLVKFKGEYSCESYDTLNITTCNSMTSPSGNYIWTASGTYIDSLYNAKGCDRIVTINLTVNYSTDSTLTITVCDSLH